MKSFKTLISEIQAHSPIVPVEATKFDLSTKEAVNEINKNLDTVLSVGFGSVGEAFNKVRKVLSMYRIELPQTEFNDEKRGSLEVPISQKDTSGENYYDVTGPNQEKVKDHKLKFSYKLLDGIYQTSAEFY
jgi:hypothetical protein